MNLNGFMHGNVMHMHECDNHMHTSQSTDINFAQCLASINNV